MANTMTINDQLAIECPECHIQVMVPIVVTLRGGMTRDAFLETVPDMADLWAHMWTHNVRPDTLMLDQQCETHGRKHIYKLRRGEDYLLHIPENGNTYMLMDCVRCPATWYQDYAEHIRKWTTGV